jgi:predicted MFS family arabinose efflux permease
MGLTRANVRFTLGVLLAVNLLNFYDRHVLGIVGQPVVERFQIDDAQLGLLTTAFIVMYAVAGLPLGLWADRGRRTLVLSAGVTVWSVFTALSGAAWNYASLFAMRLGVGIGEASCAPVATSLLGDLVPRERRARAMAIFMLGLPLGLSLSSLISGWVAGQAGWRAAFFVAGIPGLAVAFLCLRIPDPPRGAGEAHAVGTARRPGNPVWLVLNIPTMWWISISGALHNFNAYAVGAFLSPFLQRYHGLTVQGAGYVSSVGYACGGLGLIVGGWACDRIVRRRIGGRLEVSAAALAVSTACVYLALRQGHKDVFGFTAWFLPGLFFFYFYYSGVYATIQDITEPALRGTAMAVYFLAMYVLGAAMGSYVTGLVSDSLARRAATAEARSIQPFAHPIVVQGLVLPGGAAPAYPQAAVAVAVTTVAPTVLPVTVRSEHRAVGLHGALGLVPILGVGLVVVLWIGSRTVRGDYERLQHWYAEGRPPEKGES